MADPLERPVWNEALRKRREKLVQVDPRAQPVVLTKIDELLAGGSELWSGVTLALKTNFRQFDRLLLRFHYKRQHLSIRTKRGSPFFGFFQSPICFHVTSAT